MHQHVRGDLESPCAERFTDECARLFERVEASWFCDKLQVTMGRVRLIKTAGLTLIFVQLCVLAAVAIPIVRTPRWEYKVVAWSDDQFDKKAASAGQNGWEIVSALRMQTTALDDFHRERESVAEALANLADVTEYATLRQEALDIQARCVADIDSEERITDLVKQVEKFEKRLKAANFQDAEVKSSMVYFAEKLTEAVKLRSVTLKQSRSYYELIMKRPRPLFSG